MQNKVRRYRKINNAVSPEYYTAVFTTVLQYISNSINQSIVFSVLQGSAVPC
jgi:hypothetical protein